jgi:cell division protein FtsL
VKSKESVRFKDVFFFVLILTIGATFYLWTRLQVVKLGYEHQRVAQAKKQLIEESRQLSLKYAELVTPARLERYAREKLGLKKPDEKQFRFIK